MQTRTTSIVITRRKLAWYVHVTRHDSLSKTISQETVNVSRKRGGQRQTLIDNSKEWAGFSVSTLIRAAEKKEHWRNLRDYASALTPVRPTDRVLSRR
jgi:hypothetical protein